MKTSRFALRRLSAREVRLAVALLILLLVFFVFRHSHDFYDADDIARLYHWDADDNIRHVSNSTLGFQEIFVLSFPTRSERRDGIVLGASLSELKIKLIDGVNASLIDEFHAAIPPEKDEERLKDGVLGCWRGHMNAMQEIVQRNLTSVLILEDDADWDVRIRQQLRDFALSSRTLIQPWQGIAAHAYPDPTFPEPDSTTTEEQRVLATGASPPPPFHLDQLPVTVRPTVSPYGDDWDLLWLGHCGQGIPADMPDNQRARRTPQGRVVHADDATVPPPHGLYSFVQPFSVVENYPRRTRVVHHSLGGTCTTAYAVSQRGARKILRDIANKPASKAVDFALASWCDREKGQTTNPVCLTVNPTLFGSHMNAGPGGTRSVIAAAAAAAAAGEDDDGGGSAVDRGEYRNEAKTDMIRMSVRLNADVILKKGTKYIDQMKD